MRALFTCISEFAHYMPLTPVARAMLQAGHDVAFGTPEFLRPTIEAAGFRWMRAGVEYDDPEMAEIQTRLKQLPGREQVQFAREHIFGGIRPRRMVPDLLAIAETWRPDVLVRDGGEYGAMIAGELLDIPHAKVQVLAGGTPSHSTEMLYLGLSRVRATFGLSERSIPELMDRYLALTPFPASLNGRVVPIPPTVHRYRGLPDAGGEATLPAWLDRPRSRPLIYVSIGTIFSGWRGQEIFSKLLAGLRDLDAEIVVTIGHDLDPATLGPQPERVHLERFLPLADLLPRCSLALFHGGSGTLAPVVAHGLPMVILPLGADQPDNAVRCAELGISRTLDQQELTPEHIQEVVLHVLHTPSFRQAAERLRDEFNALPGPELAVELLERLARDRTPIVAAR